MAATRQVQRPHHANIYKPAGVKLVQSSVAWTDGGSTSLTSKVDLTLPIRALRLKLSGRLVISGADMTSGNPEGLLNLISNVRVDGSNSLLGGNAVLYDMDFATLWGIQHLFQHRAGYFTINGVHVPIPSTPWPAAGAAGYQPLAQGTYDFVIVLDLPFHPFKSGPTVRPGYLVRQQEWSDTLNVSLKFGSQPSGAVGCLGLPAGGTGIAFHAYGSGTGSPTIDVFSLPIQMGSLKDSVTPGLITRVQRPIATALQSAGNGVSLVTLQKQRTGRIYFKIGTATNPPAFATLSDTNVTALGLSSGGNTKDIKPLVDIYAMKADQPADYNREAIQGYVAFDFLQAGNPDSAYPGQNPNVVGAGSTFEAIANIVGVANGYAIAVQEQISFLHSGSLYAT